MMSSSASVQKARESSLGVKGANMFNLLPSTIRNTDSANVDVFKNALDEFLSKVSDHPTFCWTRQSITVDSHVERPKHYIMYEIYE